ncbi:uncharacterized protein LOC132729058 [Ruditapes philippinarum]|uniref:uncharacterized protein LOC132729058 n=1 Tax=Ruditapes philippinarum TaxID=129788 RepID=UPI00295BBB60|nr:uncharacterized protein LOC132729058 [Ruditapes philippinarum]
MNVLVGLCLFVFNVRYASSIQCYDCLTDCNDPFDSSGVKKSECDGSCMKTEKDGTAVRNCLPLLKKDSCEEAAGANVCHCTSNLCNGVSKILVPSASFIFAVIMLGLKVF